MQRAPNSKANLDRAIFRFAGSPVRETALRGEMANAIVAQMIGEGVVKGGSGLKFRFGEAVTRFTMDLDTAWMLGLDDFLSGLKSKLALDWNGFTGEVIVRKQGTPTGVPFAYVMQPCDVKLSYRGTAWYTVKLEIGHNEIGDADTYDLVEMPDEIKGLFEFLCIPVPNPIRAMKLEFQVAQKLHGATAIGSNRPHDLIDLQLIVGKHDLDYTLTRELCLKLFYYRRQQAWPPKVVKQSGWDEGYAAQKGELEILSDVDEAIVWTNKLIAKIDSYSIYRAGTTTRSAGDR